MLHLLNTAPASRAQLKSVAREDDSFETILRHPVEDIDFGFLNDDESSILEIVRVQR